MSSTDTIFSFLALLAVACFGALIALQVIEMQHYAKPPSVWPAPVVRSAS